jgi:hypothetical protein
MMVGAEIVTSDSWKRRAETLSICLPEEQPKKEGFLTPRLRSE